MKVEPFGTCCTLGVVDGVGSTYDINSPWAMKVDEEKYLAAIAEYEKWQAEQKAAKLAKLNAPESYKPLPYRAKPNRNQFATSVHGLSTPEYMKLLVDYYARADNHNTYAFKQGLLAATSSGQEKLNPKVIKALEDNGWKRIALVRSAHQDQTTVTLWGWGFETLFGEPKEVKKEETKNENV